MEPQTGPDERMPLNLSHPAAEQIVELLYGEIAPQAKRDLLAHFKICPDCAAKAARWQRTRGELDDWKIAPAPPLSFRRPHPGFKWAAAAGLMLLASLLGAQLSAARSEGRQIQRTVEQTWAAKVEPVIEAKAVAAVQREMARATSVRQQEMARLAEAVTAAASSESRRLLAEFIQTTDQKRALDYQLIRAQILRLESKYVDDSQALRKDLETVAVLTEGSLRRAQDEIVTLASFAQPARQDLAPLKQ